MATAEQDTIEIKNIKAIKHLAIPVPQDGGLVVLRGINGSGKTTALEAVSAAMGGKAKVAKREGELKGTLEGLGVTLTVNQATRIKGELEVSTLESRLSPADLVDPGIAAPEAADAKRIKALVQLSGVKATAEMFHDLAGGREAYEKLVPVFEGTDVVALAAHVKRALEAESRKEAQQAEHAVANSEAKKKLAEGVDAAAEANETKLRDELHVAVAEKAALAERVSYATKAQHAAQAARDALEDCEAEYKGPTVAEAEPKAQAAELALIAAQAKVADAKKALAEAEAQELAADTVNNAAGAQLEAAQEHAETIASWRAQLEAAAVPAPASQEIDDAEKAVQDAQAANDLGVKVREARKALVAAEAYDDEAATHRNKEEQLRKSAKAVDEVLSGVVAKLGCPLAVEDGRLITTSSRGKTYFAELSHGERWKLAVDIAIDAVGAGGVLAIPQESFEGWDPAHRQMIAEHVKGRGVVLLTAEATEGPLRAEEFNGQ